MVSVPLQSIRLLINSPFRSVFWFPYSTLSASAVNCASRSSSPPLCTCTKLAPFRFVSCAMVILPRSVSFAPADTINSPVLSDCRMMRLPDDAAAGRMGDEDNLRRGRHGYGAVRFDGGRQFQNNCAARFHGGLQRRPVRNGDGVSFRAMGKAGNAHCQEQRHTEKYDCRSFSHFVSPISSPFPIHSFLDGTKKTSARMRAGRMLSHRISRDGARCPSSSL